MFLLQELRCFLLSRLRHQSCGKYIKGIEQAESSMRFEGFEEREGIVGQQGREEGEGVAG